MQLLLGNATIPEDMLYYKNVHKYSLLWKYPYKTTDNKLDSIIFYSQLMFHNESKNK